ncbi:Hypothetical predicted protein [Olea europaea subsp. europaea]|uniref:Prolamin-like domain-containing protein n=1 Tax=Olea europaea subsp. europaea TaxID=158383 RepID=A0A8S0U0Q3_OLEEU|nr:Hypothetical predicted protein [Olea europaea subsp. europaea]
MEVSKLNSNVSAMKGELIACSFVEAIAVQTILAAQKSLACLVLLTETLSNNVDGLPNLTEKRFPMSELQIGEKPGPENRDGSDTEDDDEDDADDADGQEDDDDGDEDFSGGEEGGEDEEEGDPEDNPVANGNDGSEDEDEDDDDGDEDEDGEDDEDEEEEEEEEDQPPAKKRNSCKGSFSIVYGGIHGDIGHVAPVPEAAEVVDAAKKFYPCLRNRQHLEGCSVVDLLTVVFGYPLTESCCQVVLYVGRECLPNGWYSDESLPKVVKKCIMSSPAQNGFSVSA